MQHGANLGGAKRVMVQIGDEASRGHHDVMAWPLTQLTTQHTFPKTSRICSFWVFYLSNIVTNLMHVIVARLPPAAPVPDTDAPHGSREIEQPIALLGPSRISATCSAVPCAPQPRFFFQWRALRDNLWEHPPTPAAARNCRPQAVCVMHVMVSSFLNSQGSNIITCFKDPFWGMSPAMPSWYHTDVTMIPKKCDRFWTATNQQINLASDPNTVQVTPSRFLSQYVANPRNGIAMYGLEALI